MVHTLDMVNMLIPKESQSICRQLVIGYEFLSYNTLHTLNPVKTLQLRYIFTDFYISEAYTYSIVHLMILLHIYYETKVNRSKKPSVVLLFP